MSPAPRSALVYYPSRLLSWLFAKVWLRLRVEGRNLVPETGAFVLAANHQSSLDPFILGVGAGPRLHFVARATLARGPVGWWMRSVGTILIERDAPTRQSMETIIATLRAGTPMVYFPEGTRSRDGSLGEFRRGLLLLVKRAGVPVVPAGLDGTRKSLPRGRILPRPAACRVRIGSPIPAAELLAPGGLELLRRRVSELAGIPADQVEAGRPAFDR